MAEQTFQSLAHAAETYYEELRRFIVRRTGSLAMAEDVVQEIWIRATTSSADMPDNPKAYLYRMAGNLAIDHMRRTDRGSRTLERQASGETMDRVISAEPSPDEIVAAREEWAILTQAVEELPEKCRTVFILYRGRGMTMRQIAAKLGISDKTVEKHIARAMSHCRKRLRAAGRNV